MYVKYVQIFRKLETSYDQVVHPQKRRDMRRALEACMGRMLEVRNWLVRCTGAFMLVRWRCSRESLLPNMSRAHSGGGRSQGAGQGLGGISVTFQMLGGARAICLA